MLELITRFVNQSRQPVELLGYLGQLVFFLRFVVQWVASERRRESVIPEAFWWISLAGAVISLGYGLAKMLPPIILAQLAAIVIYGRNVYMVRRRARAAPAPPAP